MGQAGSRRPASLELTHVVRAAGGLVTRGRESGRPEVLLVHRPRYDDWTFPKGKAKPGESDEDCALREVQEETGLRCWLGPELPGTDYSSNGRPKHVRYWLMEPVEQHAAERGEVDRTDWLPLDDAIDVLTYPHDRELLRRVVPQL